MTHLGIAKFFQEKKSDMELFAVVNARDQKKFFQNQSVVKFQKTFYLYDHISNPNYNVNLDYLVSIENKYQINLFQIADTDLEFHFSNNKSSKNEILSILEQDCRFLEKVLEEVKPDYLCVPVTDRHYHMILQGMCEAKGIKILMLCPSRLGHRWIILEDLDKFDSDINYEEIQFETKSFEQLKTYLQEFPFFKNAGKDLVLYENSRKEKLSAILEYKKTMPRFIIKQLLQKRKKQSHKDFIDKNFQRQINDEINFIYFPLHAEPERALYTSVPFYSNQLEVITNIAKSLPVNFSLIVKDHPAMEFFGWRNPSFYKKIMSLPNVKIVHPSVKPNTLFEKCSGVISIGGSAGLEACFYNKSVIVFGDLNFTIIPSVFKVDKLENLPKLICKFLNTKPDPSHLSKFVAYLEKYSFEFNLPELLSDLYNQFYYGGLKTVTNISEEKLNSYFEKHQTTFCNLAEEHIKKIEYYVFLQKT